jgi:hypothetical protein
MTVAVPSDSEASQPQSADLSVPFNGEPAERVECVRVGRAG